MCSFCLDLYVQVILALLHLKKCKSQHYLNVIILLRTLFLVYSIKLWCNFYLLERLKLGTIFLVEIFLIAAIITDVMLILICSLYKVVAKIQPRSFDEVRWIHRERKMLTFFGGISIVFFLELPNLHFIYYLRFNSQSYSDCFWFKEKKIFLNVYLKKETVFKLKFFCCDHFYDSFKLTS